MKFLLDTQVLLWALTDDKRLGKRTVKDITASHNKIFVSSLSILEIATKHRAGKMRVSVEEVVKNLEDLYFIALPCDHWSAQKLAEVPLQGWKDPFDFALIAQAAAKDLPLLTADQQILAMYWSEFRAIDARR